MRPKRPRLRKCWSTKTSGPTKPSPRSISRPIRAPNFNTANMSGASRIMVVLMIAAPALVPATTPPLLNTSWIASSIGVGLPSASISAAVMRSCAPPEKNTPVLALTLAISTGSLTAFRSSGAFNLAETGMCSASAPCLARAATIDAAVLSGSADAIAKTA